MSAILEGLSGGQLLGFVAILGLVVVAVLAAIMSQWREARVAKIKADLQRDMLARGLSIEEIGRLNTSESVRLAQVEADRKVREAQIAADLQRDMLARGLSVEDIQRLRSEADAPQQEAEAGVLADAIVNMVQEGELNRNAVAGLIGVFLKKTQPAGELVRLDVPEGEAGALADAIANMVQEGELDRDAVAGLIGLFLKKSQSTAEMLRRPSHTRQGDEAVQQSAERQLEAPTARG